MFLPPYSPPYCINLWLRQLLHFTLLGLPFGAFAYAPQWYFKLIPAVWLLWAIIRELFIDPWINCRAFLWDRKCQEKPYAWRIDKAIDLQTKGILDLTMRVLGMGVGAIIAGLFLWKTLPY